MDSATRGVLTVARTVLEQLDLELVLERILEAARELTGASYAALGVLDESRTRLARFVTLGVDEAARRLIGAPPTGRGVLGELIRNPEPLRIDNVGSHPYSYGFPVGHPPMRCFLGVPIQIDGQPFGNLYLCEKHGGGEFSESDEEAAVLLADFAGVAIDHARRYAGSESQRLDLERTVSALDATIQIARALGGQTNLQAILELVAKRGRALVSARALVIELLYDDELEFSAGAGELPPGMLGTRVPLANTVASAALRSRRSQRLHDQLNRARFDQYGLGRMGLSASDGLIVPLVFRDQPYGVIVAIDHLENGEFTSEHERLLEAFAASAAIAVATARSAADERRRQRLAAAEAERSRWARELHDDTLQALGNLRLMLSGARRSRDPEAMADAIGRALEQLESDIAGLRALITELRPAALDALGLEPALLALIDRVGAGGLDVDANIDLAYEHGRCDERLDGELETSVYRIVQESLTNAMKHGEATRASVEVIEGDDRICIKVRDDGRGFDPKADTNGFGLIGIRERVELLEGEVVVTSSIGNGTTVTAALPNRRPHGLRRPPVGASSRRETA
jgi:signal transduction histidine kinase